MQEESLEKFGSFLLLEKLPEYSDKLEQSGIG